MDSKIQTLIKVAEKYDIGLSHFFVDSYTKQGIEGEGRYLKSWLYAGKDIAIIGGLLVDEPDGMIAMPIGSGLYQHQVHMLYRATINHSCDPNCRIVGFNKLVSLKNINSDEELTIDYGTVSVGDGKTIIDNCNCGSNNCRGTVRTNDYLFLDNLAAYAQYVKEESNAD